VGVETGTVTWPKKNAEIRPTDIRIASTDSIFVFGRDEND
jgi:hypothetical protein